MSLKPQELPGDWTARAACLDADPNLFFPERGQSTEAAMEFCRACPVRRECLDYALAISPTPGIFGGTSERERRRMRRRSRAS